ncbi:MAG: hypothetical protein K6U74_06375 [Firmicutes bacterium]|nr:hypothetical protein [Bacillota bacterium]
MQRAIQDIQPRHCFINKNDYAQLLEENMIIMNRIFAISVLAIIIFPVYLGAAQTRLTDKDVVFSHLQQMHQAPFPLSRIASCDQQELPYKGVDLSIDRNTSELLIHGENQTGSSWTANLPVTGLGCEIFQADLDQNGQQDLIIYSPEIGDRGSYGTRLTIIFFDRKGKPFPWQATGRFTLEQNGILEIRRNPDGNAAIIQTSEVGLPAWDGVSFLSWLYQVKDSRVYLKPESYAGTQFPHIIKANPSDIRIERIANKMDLSTAEISGDDPVQSSDPFFTHDLSATEAAKTRFNTSTTAENITNPTINTAALSNSSDQIMLSDGTSAAPPEILVVDQRNGSRRIIFQPEETDFQQLEDQKYRVHPIGTSCEGLDDCQPFILWAK